MARKYHAKKNQKPSLAIGAEVCYNPRMESKFSKRSMLDGIERTITLPISEQELTLGLYRWEVEGMLIQNAFPTLTPSQREFIMTGITDEQWDSIFKEEE